jgi:PAS domain S-box-containing protein
LVGRVSGHRPPSEVGDVPEPEWAKSTRQIGIADAGAATVTIDDNGVIVDLDEAAENLLGYPRAAAIGVAMGNLIVPARLRAAHEAGLRHYRETGDARVLEDTFQLPALCRDGTEIMVELAVSRVMTAGRPGFAGRIHAIEGQQLIPVERTPGTDFHRIIVENSPILMTVFDAHGSEVWSTPAAERLLGPMSGRRVENFIEELVHPEDADAARVGFGQAAVVGVGGPLDLRLRDADGSWRAVSVRAQNLLNHPAVHGLVLYATDVTRASVAEQQQRVEATRMMTLLEALNVGVMLQDEHRQVVLANAALVDLFDLGLPPERLLGADGRTPPDSHGNLYPDAGIMQQRIDEIIERGVPVLGEDVRLINGRVLERDYTPITMDDTTLGHLWVFRDITAQAQLRQGLEDRNRSLTELATLKGEFDDVVSHELRTP